MNTTVWRWFPLGLISAMAVVVVVNGYMVYDALSTFPGQAGTDGFDLSNEYNNVLDTARQQAALGWHIEAAATAGDRPEVRLTDRYYAPLNITSIDAHAERPVGPVAATKLAFQLAGDGRYLADKALSSGQWDVMLTFRSDQRQYSATRRIVVK